VSDETLARYFEKLLRVLGPQGWWPARTRLEIILGAILVQNTAWQNAALAIARLRENHLLSLSRLLSVSRKELERSVKSAGFYRQKARTIQDFVNWLSREDDGSLNRLFSLPTNELRRRLLNLRGLGPETVDAILLYAARRPLLTS
jgi:endonuclease-3 related protein